MRLLSPLAASLLLLGGCATTELSQTPPAGMPARVAASPLPPGSAWRYAVHDGYTKRPRGNVEYRVLEVAGDTVTVDVDDGKAHTSELYTRERNWLERPATNMQRFRYQPAYRAFDFPLYAGKRWKARTTATDPVDGRGFPVHIEGYVAGWKKVRVPAGEFDALEVHRQVHLDYFELGVRGQSRIEEVEWYAPAPNQVVRRETKSQFLRLAAGDGDAALIPVKGGGGGGRGGGGRGGHGGRDGSDGGSVPFWERDEWLVYELVEDKR